MLERVCFAVLPLIVSVATVYGEKRTVVDKQAARIHRMGAKMDQGSLVGEAGDVTRTAHAGLEEATTYTRQGFVRRAVTVKGTEVLTQFTMGSRVPRLLRKLPAAKQLLPGDVVSYRQLGSDGPIDVRVTRRQIDGAQERMVPVLQTEIETARSR
jgi:hypothetical protein